MSRLNINLVKSEVDRLYWTEFRTVRRSGVKTICSRGRFLSTMGGTGDRCDQCSPAPGAESYHWKGSRRHLEQMVEDIEADFPEVRELWIEGGFDGAENVRNYADGIYEPWVGSWELLVWTRANGWAEELCLK